MESPLTSIITVVYNSERFIKSTLDSIARQQEKNFEYIIIDGGSTDKTLDIIKQYSIVDVLVSEKDNGLYDAMNKGLNLAHGQFVWFINSGDKLFDKTTTYDIGQVYLKNPDCDVIYGQTQLIDEKGTVLGMRKKTAPNPLTANSLKMGLMVCHQSILVKKSIASQYDLNYKVSADYLWVLEALEKAKNIVYADRILSSYLENGFSANNKPLSNRERLKIMMQHFGFFPTMWAHVKILCRYIKEYKK